MSENKKTYEVEGHRYQYTLSAGYSNSELLLSVITKGVVVPNPYADKPMIMLPQADYDMLVEKGIIATKEKTNE